MFSPSGHRIYVARASDGLLVLDRVSGQELQEIDLPGPAVGLSGDLFGQWVLVRPVVGRLGLGGGRRQRRLHRHRRCRMGRGSPGRGVAQHTADPARQGCRGGGPGRRGLPGARERGGRGRRHLAAARLAPAAGGRRPGERRFGGARRGGRFSREGGVGVPPGEQLAEPGLGGGALPEAAGGRPARRGPQAGARATRRIAWCSVPTPPASRRRRRAEGSACRLSS